MKTLEIGQKAIVKYSSADAAHEFAAGDEVTFIGYHPTEDWYFFSGWIPKVGATGNQWLDEHEFELID